LVVDGEDESLAKIGALLQPLGCDVVGLSTANDAAAELNRDSYELLVVSAELPDRSGVEFVRELRGQGRFALLSVIIVVTNAANDDIKAARRAGADEAIERPLNEELFTICARQLLRLFATRRELDLRTRELLQIYQEQRAFVESLVHDLKNPIAIAHVNLAWATDRLGADDADLADALGDAQEGITRLQKMVDDLLMVGMLEQSRLPLKREYIRVTELLDQVIKSHEKEARARNVSLTLALEEGVAVVGDRAVLKRAVNSLIENSLRHTPSSGRVELSARTGAGIEITVSNTGRPLAPEERAQLMEKSESLGRPPPAGGLSLYFCRRAVEAHDGELEVIETPEWPTSLVMRLPRAG
jgi:signal transduction histidine kinase